MHTELDSSQIEVQRCTLSWAAGEAWRRVGKVGKAEVEVEQGGSGGGRGGGEEDSEEDS